MRSRPYGDGWNQAWAIAISVSTALTIIALLLVAKDAFGVEPSPAAVVQDVPPSPDEGDEVQPDDTDPEPIPTPDELPLASGTTLWCVDGLLNEEHVNGVTLADKDSRPRMTAFGFVAVNYSLLAGESHTVKVKAETEARERLEVTPFADGYRVDASGKVWVDIEVRYSRQIMADGAPLEVITRIESEELNFVIEDTSGPDPPNPDDETEPDEGGGESPFAESGLRVLIVYERDDLPRLDQEQAAVIFSGPLRRFLNEACTKKEGQPEYRILDKDAEPAGSGSQTWIGALARPRDALPWILIGDGTRGFEGPLPASVEDTIELVKGYQ